MRFPPALACLIIVGSALLQTACTSDARLAALPIDPGPGVLEPFRPGAAILSGYDDLGRGGTPRSGDRILLGIMVQRGEARYVRFLDVLMLSPSDGTPTWHTTWRDPESGRSERIESPFLPTVMTLRDERARELTMTFGYVPEVVMQHGLYESAEAMLDATPPAAQEPQAATAAPPPDPKAQRRASLGWMSLFCIAQSLARNELLEEMLWKTVEKPSLLSMLFGGLSMEISIRTDAAITRRTAVLEPDLTSPALSIPLRLSQGGRPLLDFDALVIPLEPPLGLCGGVVAIDARNPNRPDVNVHVRLLAARRGERLELP